MSSRLKKLVTKLKDLFLSEGNENAQATAELLESAETFGDVKYLATESGINKIPDDLLADSGFWEQTEVRPKPERRRRPPVTGVVRRGQMTRRTNSGRAMRVSDTHPSIRKAC